MLTTLDDIPNTIICPSGLSFLLMYILIGMVVFDILDKVIVVIMKYPTGTV